MVNTLPHVSADMIAKIKSPVEAPINNIAFDFLSQQSGSDNPSPTNVRDHNGYSTINLYQASDNVIDFESVLTEGWTNTLNGVTATYSNGYMHIKGTHNSASWSTPCPFNTCWASNPIMLPPGRYVFPRNTGQAMDRDFCICCRIDGASRINKSSNFTAYIGVEVTGFYFAVRGVGDFDCSCPVMITTAEGSDRPSTYVSYSPLKKIPITLTGTGKNLIHTKYPSRTSSGITYTVNSDWTITTSGTASAQTWLAPNLTQQPAYLTHLAPGTYFLSGGISRDEYIYLGCVKEDGTVLTLPTDTGYGIKYTFDSDVWVYLQVCITKNTTSNRTFYVQLEHGSQATTFEPYSEVSTFYGGHIDLANNKIVAEYIKIAPAKEDFGEIQNPGSGGSGIQYRATSAKYPNTASEVDWNVARQQQTCNKGRISNPWSESAWGSYTGIVISQKAYSATNAYVRISEDLYQTLEVGDTVEFVYKLAEPIEYNLVATSALKNLMSYIDVTNYWSENLQPIEVYYTVIDSMEMLRAKKRNTMSIPSCYNSIQNSPDAAEFTTDIKGKLKSCVVNFEPSQNTAPSSSSIVPVKGTKSIKLTATGKNIARLCGYTCSNATSEKPCSFKLSGSYGTSINHVKGNSVVITQTTSRTDAYVNSYLNGYICIMFEGLEFGRYYRVAYDITDITSNPLNASLSDVLLCVPQGGQYRPYSVDGNRLSYEIYYRPHETYPNRISCEIRTCAMSCTLSNVTITMQDEVDTSYSEYEEYSNKNLIRITGFSAQTPSTSGTYSLTNNYGTTISMTECSNQNASLVVTQNVASTDYSISDYHNGYFCIDTQNLEYGKTYNISMKITDIVSNPLNATFNDLRLCSPSGGGLWHKTYEQDRIIWTGEVYSQKSNGDGTTCFDMRNCGMSFTISEIMVTEVNADPTKYVPHVGNPYVYNFPIYNKNLFSYEDMRESGWYRYFPNYMKEAGTYTVSCQHTFGGTGNIGCRISLSNIPENGGEMIGDPLTGWSFATNELNKTATFTLTEEQANAPWIRFEMLSSGSTINDFINGQIQIEKGSSATVYVPFDDAMYGGSLDVNNGILIQTWECVYGRWGDIKTGSPNETTGLQFGTINFQHPVLQETARDHYGVKAYCNCCATTAWEMPSWTPEHFYIYDSKAYVVLPGTLDDDTIIQVVAKLVEPIEHHIDDFPQTIVTLKGDNVIRCDVQQTISVQYWARHDPSSTPIPVDGPIPFDPGGGAIT